jgi:hypothetical protein
MKPTNGRSGLRISGDNQCILVKYWEIIWKLEAKIGPCCKDRWRYQFLDINNVKRSTLVFVKFPQGENSLTGTNLVTYMVKAFKSLSLWSSAPQTTKTSYNPYKVCWFLLNWYCSSPSNSLWRARSDIDLRLVWCVLSHGFLEIKLISIRICLTSLWWRIQSRFFTFGLDDQSQQIFSNLRLNMQFYLNRRIYPSIID